MYLFMNQMKTANVCNRMLAFYAYDKNAKTEQEN